MPNGWDHRRRSSCLFSLGLSFHQQDLSSSHFPYSLSSEEFSAHSENSWEAAAVRPPKDFPAQLGLTHPKLSLAHLSNLEPISSPCCLFLIFTPLPLPINRLCPLSFFNVHSETIRLVLLHKVEAAVRWGAVQSELSMTTFCSSLYRIFWQSA